MLGYDFQTFVLDDLVKATLVLTLSQFLDRDDSSEGYPDGCPILPNKKASTEIPQGCSSYSKSVQRVSMDIRNVRLLA